MFLRYILENLIILGLFEIIYNSTCSLNVYVTENFLKIEISEN